MYCNTARAKQQGLQVVYSMHGCLHPAQGMPSCSQLAGRVVVSSIAARACSERRNKAFIPLASPAPHVPTCMGLSQTLNTYVLTHSPNGVKGVCLMNARGRVALLRRWGMNLQLAAGRKGS